MDEFHNDDEGHGAASMGLMGIGRCRKTANEGRLTSTDYSLNFIGYESA